MPGFEQGFVEEDEMCNECVLGHQCSVEAHGLGAFPAGPAMSVQCGRVKSGF